MVSLKALCALLIFKLPPPIQEQLTEQYIFLGGEGGGGRIQEGGRGMSRITGRSIKLLK